MLTIDTVVKNLEGHVEIRPTVFSDDKRRPDYIIFNNTLHGNSTYYFKSYTGNNGLLYDYESHANHSHITYNPVNRRITEEVWESKKPYSKGAIRSAKKGTIIEGFFAGIDHHNVVDLLTGKKYQILPYPGSVAIVSKELYGSVEECKDLIEKIQNDIRCELLPLGTLKGYTGYIIDFNGLSGKWEY